jgi:hypothetical protein
MGEIRGDGFWENAVYCTSESTWKTKAPNRWLVKGISNGYES